MVQQKENRNNFLESVIFIALLLLSICAFSKNSDKISAKTFHYELVSELHSNHAAILDAQQIFCQKSLIPLIDKSNFRIYNEDLKIIADNRLLDQRMIYLQKAELVIKLITLQRFYHQHLNIDTEDLPILG